MLYKIRENLLSTNLFLVFLASLIFCEKYLNKKNAEISRIIISNYSDFKDNKSG